MAIPDAPAAPNAYVDQIFSSIVRDISGSSSRVLAQAMTPRGNETLDGARQRILTELGDANSGLSNQMRNLVSGAVEEASRNIPKPLLENNILRVENQNLTANVSDLILQSLSQNLRQMHLNEDEGFTPANQEYLRKGLIHHLDETRQELHDSVIAHKKKIDGLLDPNNPKNIKPDDNDQQALKAWNDRQDALKKMQANLKAYIDAREPFKPTDSGDKKSDKDDKEEAKKQNEQQQQPPYESLPKKLRDRTLLDDKGIQVAMMMNILFIPVFGALHFILGTIMRTVREENTGPVDLVLNFLGSLKKTSGELLGLYPMEQNSPGAFIQELWNEIRFHSEAPQAGDNLSEGQKVAATTAAAQAQQVAAEQAKKKPTP